MQESYDLFITDNTIENSLQIDAQTDKFELVWFLSQIFIIIIIIMLTFNDEID